MGIMTMTKSDSTSNAAVVCEKKCEVKLERLNPDQQNQQQNTTFKRPLSSILTKAEAADQDHDLRPPVKLKVKIGTQGQPNVVKEANKNVTTANTKAPPAAAPSGLPPVIKKELPPYNPPGALPKPFAKDLSSTELLKAIDELGFHPEGKISTSLAVRENQTHSIPDPPKLPKVPLSNEELLPLTPCVYVNNAEEAFSPQLLDLCLKRPIVLVRNLANACNMDLSLYTTKTLVEMHPNHPVEIRSQMEQTSDENWAPNMEKPVWYCTSSRAHTSIAKYAEYQAETIRDHFQQTNDRSANPKFDFKDSSTRRMIKFGTNCDLSDEKKWSPQLKELNKLPAWARVVSAGNMLSHIGNQILGMNTVQLYMKVPCARTPGHQENNNFCAVNINIGPGDSEWFGVPNDYWGALQNLCAKNKVDYLHGSWWPKMEELREAGIPCYRFMQRPGDLVWVNVGCVHWVQAAGWCNNIAWNVGPITDRQLELALERYEWNKSQRFQSIVAMCLLTWNLARNLKITDIKLYHGIQAALQQSMRFSQQTQKFVRSKGVDIRYHGRRKNEPAHYCGTCDEEVFNNLMVKEHEKRHVVYCLHCSLAQDPNLKGFICLEEYTNEELCKVYDEFKLLPLSAASKPPSGLGYCQQTSKI